jgi:sulfur carrier protein
MEIILNGVPTLLETGSCTLAQLLELKGIMTDTRGVAAAVNQELIPRALWAVTLLQPGDRVEIVRAQQGG